MVSTPQLALETPAEENLSGVKHCAPLDRNWRTARRDDFVSPRNTEIPGSGFPEISESLAKEDRKVSMKLKQCLEVIESHVALSNGLFNFGIHKVLLTVIFVNVSRLSALAVIGTACFFAGHLSSSDFGQGELSRSAALAPRLRRSQHSSHSNKTSLASGATRPCGPSPRSQADCSVAGSRLEPSAWPGGTDSHANPSIPSCVRQSRCL